MTKIKKRIWVLSGFLVFILYIFCAARPIPQETVLKTRWLSTLDSYNTASATQKNPFPFQLGKRFGYINDDGSFLLSRTAAGYTGLSQDAWTEYYADSEQIEVRSFMDEPVLNIENPAGYPFFLDRRIFLIGREQNTLYALDGEGNTAWIYDFGAPVTCIDASAGIILAGLLDGVIEILDYEGRFIYRFEPGGSRLPVILGVSVSSDGTKLALIAGIDQQRFLLLERSGESYKAAYHEFLGSGYRRPVHIFFADEDRRVIFERESGLGIFEINSRQSITVPVDGKIAAIHEGGGTGYVFLVSSKEETVQNLILIKLPGSIVMKAPFKSGDVFLGTRNKLVYIGGGNTIASFEMEKR